MKKCLISLGVVASLYGSVGISNFVPIISNFNFNFSSTNNTTNESGSANGSVEGSVSSSEDTSRANKYFNSNNSCYNAFSVNSKTDTKYIPSIITQIQNQKFYLFITNKCKNTESLKITLINKNTGKEIADYDINSTSKSGQLVVPVIQVKVHNAYKDLLVHFSYDRVDGSGSGKAKVDSNGGNGNASVTKTTTHHEENSTDDFAVRPKQFNISADSSVFVGKPLKINITATGEDDKISTNYYASDLDLNTTITDSKTHLSYYFDIVNGKLAHHRFFFTKPSDDVKIDISEKIGQEWAIVDSDDTNNNRRLIASGESNSIKVNETSKSWAGAGTNEKENNPANNTIQSNTRNNVNMNIKFSKMNW